MGILDEIKQLGLRLTNTDVTEMKKISDEFYKVKQDDFIKKPLVDIMITEYISKKRPDIMSALLKERKKQYELRKQLEKPKCDFCNSTDNLIKCKTNSCDKYLCPSHVDNYDGYCYLCDDTFFHGDD